MRSSAPIAIAADRLLGSLTTRYDCVLPIAALPAVPFSTGRNRRPEPSGLRPRSSAGDSLAPGRLQRWVPSPRNDAEHAGDRHSGSSPRFTATDLGDLPEIPRDDHVGPRSV